MKGRTKRRIRRTVTGLVAFYLIGGIALFFFQDQLLFHPRPLAKDYLFSFDQPFTEMNIPFQKNNISIVQFKPSSHRKGVVLFFHGNMHNVEHYNKYPSLFTRNGYEVWMIDYPGFGKTTGERSEQIIEEEALLFYDLAAKEIAGDSILIYGKSIGTGIAAFVASQKQCKRLILETPYYSIDALAKHYFPIYPVIPLAKYTFPTYAYLKNVAAPVTIFHGTHDEVIPFRQGKKLAAENNGAGFIPVEKGKHNNLFSFPLFQQKMDSLLATQ
jgi:alpha-beta hydrolase superfamily lysophospholipase